MKKKKQLYSVTTITPGQELGSISSTLVVAKSIKEIADIVGCHRNTVSNKLKNPRWPVCIKQFFIYPI